MLVCLRSQRSEQRGLRRNVNRVKHLSQPLNTPNDSLDNTLITHEKPPPVPPTKWLQNAILMLGQPDIENKVLATSSRLCAPRHDKDDYSRKMKESDMCVHRTPTATNGYFGLGLVSLASHFFLIKYSSYAWAFFERLQLKTT